MFQIHHKKTTDPLLSLTGSTSSYHLFIQVTHRTAWRPHETTRRVSSYHAQGIKGSTSFETFSGLDQGPDRWTWMGQGRAGP